MQRVALISLAVAVPTVVVLAFANRKAFSRKLFMSREIMDAYTNYVGKPEYYFYQPKGFRCHSGIVVRGQRESSKEGKEGMKPLPAMFIHLSLLKNGWVIRCHQTKWAPISSAVVQQATKEWDMGTALDTCLDAACAFKFYNVATHNCRTFRDWFLRNMVKSRRKVMAGSKWTEAGVIAMAQVHHVELIIDSEAEQRKLFDENAPRPILDYLFNCRA